jgi:hypothetical protein
MEHTMTKAIDETTLSLRLDKAGIRHGCEPEFAFFVWLISFREELRARKKGFILVRDDDGRDFCFLRRRPYNPAYNAALVDAIAAEVDDGSDCVELEELHCAQRRARNATIAAGSFSE